MGIMLQALLACSMGAAQGPPEVVWGPKWEYPRPDEVLQLFGHHQHYFFALTKEASRKQAPLTLHKLDTDSLHVQARMAVQFPEKEGRQPSFHRCLAFGGRSYVVSTTLHDTDAEVHFDAWPILDSGEELGSPTRLGSMPKDVLGRTRNYRIEASADQRYLAVVMPQEYDPSRNDKFQVRLFDAALQLLHDKKLEVPHPFGEVHYGDLLVDGTTAVYLLMSRPGEAGRDIGKVQNPGRDHYLLRYDWEQNTLSEKALSIGVKWIYSAQMALNRAGQLHIAGYFSNMIDLVMSGTFSVTFDVQTGVLINAGLQPFERSFKAAFRAGSGSERTDLSMFDPGYVFPYQEDALLLISEKKEVQTSTMFNPATGTYFTVQNYMNDDLLLSSITGSGTASLNLRVPKYQSSSRSAAEFLSYIAFPCPGPSANDSHNVCVIFNDHERNAQLDMHSGGRYSVLSSASQAQAVLYMLGPSAQLKKHILFRQSPHKATFNPSVYYPLSDGVILLTSSNQSLEFVRLRMQAAE